MERVGVEVIWIQSSFVRSWLRCFGHGLHSEIYDPFIKYVLDLKVKWGKSRGVMT